MARFLIPLVAFLLLVGFLARGLWLDPREVPSPLIDKPAPTFQLARLDDPSQSISRQDLLGKVWLLNVWASWCVACREEHPLMVEFAKTGIVPIYGLDYKDTRDAGLQWLGRLGNPYAASLVDADGKVGIDFGVYGVPETFLIDKAGVVRYKQIGPMTPEVLERTIVPLVRRLNG
ncbi:MAG TPA: DsbE family thiol:disulfide interchange protein [Burkholderiaceae bacterium]|nr:DsbE family thiol:disulfide interchange protein [Burkholderiaceae bacterium]